MNFLRRRASRPWAVGVLSCLLVASLGTGTAPPAGAAAAQPAERLFLVLRIDSGAMPLSDDELSLVYAGLENAISFVRNKRGWACVTEPPAYSPSYKLANMFVDVTLTPGPGGESEGGALAEAVVTLRGQQLGDVGGPIPVSSLQLTPDNRGPALRGASTAAFIATAVDQQSPCPGQRGRIHGKAKFDELRDGEGFREFEMIWEGTFQIPSRPGRFYADDYAQVTQNLHFYQAHGSQDARVIGGGRPLDCQSSWSGEELMQVTGIFDDEAASVLLDAVMLHVDYGRTPDPKWPLTCTPASPPRQPLQLASGDLLRLDLATAAHPIQLPLADRSQVETPPPLTEHGMPFKEWQSTIEVQDSSDDEDIPPSSPPVASIAVTP